MLAVTWPNMLVFLCMPAKRGNKPDPEPPETDRLDKGPEERHRAMTWMQRLKRAFNIDIEVCEHCGGSTGTNVFAALQIMAETHKKGQSGSEVPLICDSGERYQHTYYDQNWLQEQGFDLSGYHARLDTFYHNGEFSGHFVNSGASLHRETSE